VINDKTNHLLKLMQL